LVPGRCHRASRIEQEPIQLEGVPGRVLPLVQPFELGARVALRETREERVALDLPVLQEQEIGAILRQIIDESIAISAVVAIRFPITTRAENKRQLRKSEPSLAPLSIEPTAAPKTAVRNG
jgi:hypothetical protein